MRVVNDWAILDMFSEDGRRWYHVRCKCGRDGKVRKDHVENGRSKRCKVCSSKQTLIDHPSRVFGPRDHKGVGDLGRTFWSHIQSGARKRGIDFNISVEYAWYLFLAQGCRCALSGDLINLSPEVRGNNPDYSKFTASLDRKDSAIGYVEGNVQWVHKTINCIKRDLSDEAFTDWCRKVSNNFSDRIEL